jgi:ribosomal protein L11 methyltransferase
MDFIKVLYGDVGLAIDMYDVIFANINRNIITRDIPEYIKHLNKSGILLLSGFYEADIPIVSDIVETNGLKLTGRSEKNNWAILKFKK